MLIIYSVNATVNKYLNSVIMVCSYVSVFWGAICYVVKVLNHSQGGIDEDGGVVDREIGRLAIWGH